MINLIVLKSGENRASQLVIIVVKWSFIKIIILQITWVDSDGGVLTQGVNYTIEPMPDGRRFTAR